MSACEEAAPVDVWCAALAEYRLDDLARISGVSSRNIRAYRERGLLDPPRTAGPVGVLRRLPPVSAEHHQSAASQGVQQRAHRRVLRPHARGPRSRRPSSASSRRSWAARATTPSPRPSLSISIPESDEAQRLLSCGLAELVENSVSLVHPADGRDRHAVDGSTLLRSDDRAGGRIHRRHRSTSSAATLVAALEEAVAARYGSGVRAEARRRSDEVAGLIEDYRDLGIAVVTHLLDKGLQRHMVSAVSDYTTGDRGPRGPGCRPAR